MRDVLAAATLGRGLISTVGVHSFVVICPSFVTKFLERYVIAYILGYH
jgi:hypothetical protein